ncbi:MAG: hypothetical protein OEY23_22035 [Acidimicrobiia bacterium]|nr:hypothetical protein [Acidimicrobiia bacterium]
MDAASPESPDDEVATTAPPRWLLPVLMVPIAVMIAMSNIATVTWASLVDSHPLWLLGLSSINRYLALTTNQLDAWSYYLVGTARLFAPDLFFYFLGLHYGERALRWVERRLPSMSQMLRTLERLFERAAWPVVFVAPNNPVSLLAGASRLPLGRFVAVNLAGTVARLALIRRLGNVFSSPIEGVLGFVAQYRWPILAVSALSLAYTLWNDRRRGGGEIEAFGHLRDDLEEG